MATRFYLPSTGAAAVSPAFDAAWEVTADAIRGACVTTRINSAQADDVAFEGTSTTNARDILIVQYVSAPISAQTITGTMKARAKTSEETATANYISQIIVRVVSNDGSTFRGTLYGGDTGTTNTSEWVLTITNRSFPRAALAPVTLSSVAAQANDRIVIEMGWRALNTAATDWFGLIKVGDNSGTDLPEDETTTAANNPWVEFSADLFSVAATSLVSGPRQRARTRQGELLQL